MTGDLNEAVSYCPQCGAEYREGFEVCADDGTKLVHGPKPPEPVEPPEPVMAPRVETGAKWVKLAEYGREDSAHLLAGRLEAEGIPVTLSPESLADIYGPGTSAFLGKGIEICVPEDRLLKARQLVEELESAWLE